MLDVRELLQLAERWFRSERDRLTCASRLRRCACSSCVSVVRGAGIEVQCVLGCGFAIWYRREQLVACIGAVA